MSDLALVAGEDPGSAALHRDLEREWAQSPEGGRCVRLAGPVGAGELEGFDVVVYAAGLRAAGAGGDADQADARAVLEAAAAAGCRLLVVSSTEVHSPHHHHLGFVAEERLASRPGVDRVSEAWRALEEAASAVATASGRPLTVLRAAPAPVPGGRDFWSRQLAGPLAPTVPGYDPSIQLLATEDLARAVALAAAALASSASPGATGTFHVVPAGTVPVHCAVRLAGARRLPVPRWMQRLIRRRRVDFLRHPWTAGGERARRELGFEPRVSAVEVAAAMSTTSGSPPQPLDPLPTPDPFGMDRAYIARYGRTLFRFLHDAWWRIEARGLEHVPQEGPAVLTGVHRGFMPYDGAMALHLLVRERARYPRFLLHPTLVKFPFLTNFMTKLGGIPACQENADWVLEGGGLLGIFPEGIWGAFTPYRRAYRLGGTWRDDYVRMALRKRAPIVPFVTVGSAEIFPILARFHWPWFQRLTEWPCFPVAPPFPLLPLPLPSKWHTRFLEPLPVQEEHGPEAADDPEVVRAISAEVRRRMEGALAEMLARRRSIFFGSVFDDAPAG